MLSGALRKLAIDRPAARAWAMYDWANSAYFTVIVTAVFPLYFVNVAGTGLQEGAATRRLSAIIAIGMIIVALIAPAAGALADFAAARKKLLAGFMSLGVLATAAMFFIGEGDLNLACALVLVGNIGIVGSLVCYDGLLSHVAREGEMDRLSTTGFGLGYLGGGLLLGFCVAWIKRPEWFGLGSDPESTLPVRLAFVAVAVWWAVFSIPLLRKVQEPPRVIESDESAAGSAVFAAFRRLKETLAELRGYKQAFLLLVAALVFGEGIGTIIKLSGAYAADLKLEETAIMIAFFLTQFIGVPCAVLFGWIAGRIGARRAIYITLAAYVGVCVYGFFLETERDFYILAATVGTVQGGAQALGRSLFASVIPKHKSTEFFGFFAFASKLAGSVGPAMFFGVATLTGSNRYAILALIVFFALGAFLLSRVDVEEGQRVAQAADEELKAA